LQVAVRCSAHYACVTPVDDLQNLPPHQQPMAWRPPLANSFTTSTSTLLCSADL